MTRTSCVNIFLNIQSLSYCAKSDKLVSYFQMIGKKKQLINRFQKYRQVLMKMTNRKRSFVFEQLKCLAFLFLGEPIEKNLQSYTWGLKYLYRGENVTQTLYLVDRAFKLPF